MKPMDQVQGEDERGVAVETPCQGGKQQLQKGEWDEPRWLESDLEMLHPLVSRHESLTLVASQLKRRLPLR